MLEELSKARWNQALNKMLDADVHLCNTKASEELNFCYHQRNILLISNSTPERLIVKK